MSWVMRSDAVRAAHTTLGHGVGISQLNEPVICGRRVTRRQDCGHARPMLRLGGFPRGAVRRAVAPDCVTAQPAPGRRTLRSIFAPGWRHPAQHVESVRSVPRSPASAPDTGGPVRLLGETWAPERQHRDHLQIRQQSLPKVALRGPG